MKIALTGATGFLGRHIANHLASRGHEIRAWVRPKGDRGGFEPAKGRVEWIAGRLDDDKSARALVRGQGAIVHSALDHRDGRFRSGEGELLAFLSKNILGTIRLIEAARTAGVPRFIFISTCSVHEKILDDRPLDEAHPLWPRSHYGAHKAAIEKFVHSYGLGTGYEICSLRPTGIYGPARPVEDSKWFDLVRGIARGEEVTVERGGKEVHARDVARAVEILLTAKGVAGEAYNCCDGYVSEFDVARIAKEITGSASRIRGRRAKPKHRIETKKLRALGMSFGGRPLLVRTIREMAGGMAHG